MGHEISFVVPCFNEETNIGQTLHSINRACLSAGVNDFQIIVIDDGSLDSTGYVADAEAGMLGIRNFRLITHSVNQGYAAAIRAGIHNSSNAKWVLIVPGEGDVPYEGILRLLISKQEVDAVLGYYSFGVDRPLVRRLISSLFTKVMNFVSGCDLKYANSPGKYRTCEIPELNSNCFAIIAELNFKLAMSGAVIDQVEIPFTAVLDLEDNRYTSGHFLIFLDSFVG